MVVLLCCSRNSTVLIILTEMTNSVIIMTERTNFIYEMALTERTEVGSHHQCSLAEMFNTSMCVQSAKFSLSDMNGSGYFQGKDDIN